LVAITRKKAMLSTLPSNKPAGRSAKFSSMARGVRRLNLLYVNAYFLEGADGQQVLVDSGLGLTATHLKEMLPARPKALVLTHGHCDHAGAAKSLAYAWGVPVYAHVLELAYLSGRAIYPAEDLSAGGPAALFSCFFRNRSVNLGDYVRPLPADGTIPHLPDWRWVHTPGHTPGHISLFREWDRTLISGDALLTTDVGSWVSQLTQRQEMAGPPSSSTFDWPSAVHSIHVLAGLEPLLIAAGHGRPMSGPKVAPGLRAFAAATRG
jgi:glyoxylase-like metal-dependent hydrolase (beta-lactamase superfamily II)